MKIRVRASWQAVLLVVLIAGITTGVARHASAQPAAGHAHDMPGEEADMSGALCPTCPAGREAAGTSWQPDATTMRGRHVSLGPWRVMVHAQAALVAIEERGARGGSATFSANHVMFDARRQAAGGTLGVRSMWTIEPEMGPDGYPLLLQTGESADGITPLIDRQHPHDLPMELAVTYGRAIAPDQSFFVYAAAVGSPALGPPAFMHRPSADTLPIAPITHHWFDSTHISFGVVTAGLVMSPRARIEASAFRGREPDQHRWNFERPALDSFSTRLSIAASSSLSLQVSAGFINSPERLHPASDVALLTGSALYAGAVAGGQFDATLGWARQRRNKGLMPVEGGWLVYPGGTSQAVLAEATWRRARHVLVARTEFAQKDEMFPMTDLRHTTFYPVSRTTAGYVFEVVEQPAFSIGLGAGATWLHLASTLRDEYGGPPVSGLALLTLRMH